jgi:predicted membrane-bound spermidine synthase
VYVAGSVDSNSCTYSVGVCLGFSLVLSFDLGLIGTSVIFLGVFSLIFCFSCWLLSGSDETSSLLEEDVSLELAIDFSSVLLLEALLYPCPQKSGTGGKGSRLLYL